MAQSVDDLLDQVRTQLDETNTENATNAQLIQALNRAQRSATNIISRKYASMFWSSSSFTTSTGTRGYDIPTAAHGRKVEMVEVDENGQRYELRRVGNNRTSSLTSPNSTSRPVYYSLTKNQIEIYPIPSASLTIYAHFIKRPETLVLSQGRITSTASGYVIVDTLGSSLSTSTTGFGAYVNIIDFNTGEVKGTMQIAALDTTLKKVTFKSSGLTRSTVLGRTVSTTLPTDIAVDDYICLVSGTAVSELDEAYTDYLVQYAVVEIRRRFGETIAEEMSSLSSLEKEIDRMWVGREADTKIRKANTHFHRGITRRLVN